MPSSYTPHGVEQQAAGENVNTWGSPHLDNALFRLDNLTAGYVAVPITGDTALTSQTSSTGSVNNNDFQAFTPLLKFTGALAANATITVPSIPMRWAMWNATNKALTITTGAGTTLVIDAGDRTIVECDGMAIQTISFGGLGLKEFIAASVLAATGSLPATTGNEGKALLVRSGLWTPSQIQSTDIGDFDAAVRQRTLIYSLIFGGG